MREYVPAKMSKIPEEAKLVFKGEIFDTYQWPQQIYDGRTVTFEMLRRADTVSTIAIKNGKVVLLRQKQPRRDWYYSYPGGRVDEQDENELAAAKREMREEAGMQFRNWRLIRVKQPLTKIDWLDYLFLATDFISQGEQELDGGEIIEVRELEFEAFLTLTEDPQNYRLGFEPRLWQTVRSLEDLLSLPSLYTYANN